MSRRFVALTFLLLSLAVVASRLTAELRAGGGDHTLKGWNTGAITQLAPGAWVIDYDAGSADHLGQTTREDFITVNPDGSVTGTVVITTAKGDEVWAVLAGAFTSPAMIQGTYAFAGGTGRFAAATGKGTFIIYAPSRVTATLQGTINY